jgi:2-dehydropantoate 2-reductase
MRFVIYGAGAIGGVAGARLHQSGHDVALIARGAHGEAIAAHGLTLITPKEHATLRIPVALSPYELQINADDVVMLATKGQDTWDALTALRAATDERPALVLLQNGVENERMALRLFPDVYGALVMSPTAHVEPGTVLAYGTSFTGTLDIGRYPTGIDALTQQVCAALERSRYESIPRENIMVYKYAKMITNLGNAVQAVCGLGPDAKELTQRVRAEGRAVLSAVGIPHDVPDVLDINVQWKRWGAGEIDGLPRQGGSTWQSITRGTGSVESDYLNGEIVLLARQNGLEAPLNETLQRLAQETARGGHQPGWRSAESISQDVARAR